ncbi:HTH-type transcriptional regulator GalR [compost metagenome]
MVTAKQVAEQLGIAVSTVGRAMADDPRISAETKAKVRKMAEQLGYVGNTAARVMRGGSSKLIGLLLPDVTNDFYATIAQALSECCDAEGYRLILSIHNDDREVEFRHIKELAAARVAGVITVPTAAPRRDSINLLRSLPHAQLLRNVPALNPICFGIDDEVALREATAHLLALGHRRIAYIGGQDIRSTGASRLAGFHRAFADMGIDRGQAIEMLGEPTRTFGVQATSELLRGRKKPTAIVMGSIHATLGMLEVLSEQRIAVPDDLSVVGFGDPLWFAWWGAGLTTVRPPIQELATTCGLWFLHHLKNLGKESTGSSHKAVSSSSLVVRGSTAAIAVSPAKGRAKARA